MSSPDLLPQAGTCAAPGCVRVPAEGRLCPGHRKTLSATLADLAADLTARSDVSIGGWRVGGGSSGTLASERDPINLRLMDAQADAPPVLAAWAQWLCEQRTGLTRGGGPEGDVALLRYDFDWLVRQPEVTDAWCQLRALWSTLRGHLPVRQCTCGGPVWSAPGGGWCSWCSQSWSGSALLALGRRNVA